MKTTTPKFLEFPKFQKNHPKLWIFGNSSGSLKIQKPSKFLEFPKFKKSKNIHPKVWIFGNSSGSLKIQKSSKFLEFPKFQKSKKIHPKVWIFGNSSGSLKIQKSSKFLEFPKFQKSKKITPEFGFLETRAGTPKSKNRANSSSFQNSKTPKTPTQVLDFWKLEREPQNPKIEQIPRVSKIPNLGVGFLDFWNFGNSRNLLDFWILRKFLEFPKFQKSKNSNPSFGFLETRAGASKSKIRAPARVSKIPNLEVGFLDFWNFGNSSGSSILGF